MNTPSANGQVPITCETQGHLWGRGDYGDICIMCKTPKPQDSPTSKAQLIEYLSICADLADNPADGVASVGVARLRSAIALLADEPSARIAELERELADTREAFLNQSARLVKAEPPVTADLEEIFAVWRRFGLNDAWLAAQIRAALPPSGAADLAIARSCLGNLYAAVMRRAEFRGEADLQFAMREAQQCLGGVYAETKSERCPHGKRSELECIACNYAHQPKLRDDDGSKPSVETRESRCMCDVGHIYQGKHRSGCPAEKP